MLDTLVIGHPSDDSGDLSQSDTVSNDLVDPSGVGNTADLAPTSLRVFITCVTWGV